MVACQTEAEHLRIASYQLDQTIYSRVDRFRTMSQSGLMDSFVVDSRQFFNFGRPQRISCAIYAKDMVLGKKDSVRVGIIHPLEKMYSYPLSEELPDYIVLSVYGQDTIPFELEHQNVGPVTNRTYFRINRNFYALTALDSNRQEIEVKALERRPSSPTVAELVTQFKQTPVRTLAGQDTLVRHEYGKKTVLYFFGVGTFKAAEHMKKLTAEIDNLGKDIQLILIDRNDTVENVEKFLADNDIDRPAFMSTAATCGGLQCIARLPYAVVINEQGRIVSHYVKPNQLLDYLQ